MTDVIRVDFDGQPLEFPAGTSPQVIQATVKKLAAQRPQAPAGEGRTLSSLITGEQETPAMRSGRGMNSSAQGAMTALQGPTFGFLDELAGVGGGITGAIANLTPYGDNKTFAQNYRETRDKVRGANKQFTEDYPVTAIGTQLAASAPTIAAAPLRMAAAPAAATKAMTLGRQLAQQGKIGAGYGAASGAGESTADTLGGVIEDAAKGAATSAALGSAAQLGGSAAVAGGRNVVQRFSESSAKDKARLMLAETLAKDAAARGEIVAKNPGEWVAARVANRGAGATIADAAGANTTQRLDTLANLSGRAKDDVERLIAQRQSQRGRNLGNAAAENLGTSKDYLPTLTNIIKEKKSASQPFYDQLEGVQYRVDKELADLLHATKAAHGDAEQLILQDVNRAPVKLSQINKGDEINHVDLDTLKKSLWDMAEKSKGEFGKATAMSQSFDSLRTRLTDKLDRLAPKTDKGESIYKLARDAFAGPAEMESALRAGRTVMKESDPLVVKELVQGMSKSEREVFNVGVLQAIREKAGTDAGQTSLLKMWRNPATSERLKDIFGDNYREFAAAVAKERALKGMERVGRGSQTAARLLDAGEMDGAVTALNAGHAALNAAKGNPVGAVASAAQGVNALWNKVKTPEQVRDELAKLLLLKGPQAHDELTRAMPELIRRRNKAAAAASTGIGTGAAALQRE